MIDYKRVILVAQIQLLAVTLDDINSKYFQQTTAFMVDKERRKKLALHLRHLSVGLISNDNFEDKIMEDVTNGWLPEQYHRTKKAKVDDQIILPILELCWCLYSDTKRYKLIGGYKLADEQLKDIARYILFLHSDLEYEWPYIDITNPIIKVSFKDLLLAVLTLGQNIREENKKRKQQIEELKGKDDMDLWPFFSRHDYDEQLKKQPFLNGKPDMFATA